jgi:hypothetical protein
MQALPRLGMSRDRQRRNVPGHSRFPLGQFFIPTIEAQAQGETHWPTDMEAGDRLMGQGIGAIAVIIVAVHIVKETANEFTQGTIDCDHRVAAALAMGGGLLEHEPDASAIDCVPSPRRLRKNTRAVRFVCAVEDAPRNMGHALVGQHDEPREIMLEMPQLAVVLKQVPDAAAWSLTTGAGATIGHSIRHPLVLVSGVGVAQG